MELTSYLILLDWIIKHTFLLSENDNNFTTNNELKETFFKKYPETKPVLNNQISLLIGYCLKFVYEDNLIKESGGGVAT